MKLLTMAAATFAVLFAAKPADALTPVCLYDTITPLAPTTPIYYTSMGGSNFMGDIFIPAVVSPQPLIGNVDGIFVDTTGVGGTFNIIVDFWDNDCMGASGGGVPASLTFGVTLPPGTAGDAYIVTFPVGCTFGYTPTPGPEVAISFNTQSTQVLPTFADIAPSCGTGYNGISLDANQNGVLEPCAPGTEWFGIAGWNNLNLLVSIYDCSPSSMLHGPFAKQDAMVRKLDVKAQKLKGLLNVAKISK